MFYFWPEDHQGQWMQKKAFPAWLALRTSKSANRYQKESRTAAAKISYHFIFLFSATWNQLLSLHQRYDKDKEMWGVTEQVSPLSVPSILSTVILPNDCHKICLHAKCLVGRTYREDCIITLYALIPDTEVRHEMQAHARDKSTQNSIFESKSIFVGEHHVHDCLILARLNCLHLQDEWPW